MGSFYMNMHRFSDYPISLKADLYNYYHLPGLQIDNELKISVVDLDKIHDFFIIGWESSAS